MSSREVVVWVPPGQRPEALEDARKKAELAEVRSAELAARKAAAERRERHARIHETGGKLVLAQLEKLLRLSQQSDFKDSPGPIDVKDMIKLAEMLSKDYRLDTGQATANIAHVITPSIDFSTWTQEERDTWRRLAVKAGAPEE